MQKSTFLTPRNENSSNIVFEKATVVCENADDEKIAANYPSGMVYHKSSKSKKCIEEIWKERAHTLADIVCELEIQKRRLQKSLKAAQLQLKQPPVDDTSAVGALGLPGTMDDSQMALWPIKSRKSSDTIDESNLNKEDCFSEEVLQPSVSQHKSNELVVLREDNAAKEKELLHALDLLQQAQMREEELRRQASNLSAQLQLLRSALEHSHGDVDILEKEIEDIEELVLESHSILLTPASGDSITSSSTSPSSIQHQLEVSMLKDEAKMLRTKAAMLESALKAKSAEKSHDDDDGQRHGLEDDRGIGGAHALRSVALSVVVVRCIVAGMAFMALRTKNL